jgi:enamine deaminase RidA (YjgF/YER057c/UK114 family)
MKRTSEKRRIAQLMPTVSVASRRRHEMDADTRLEQILDELPPAPGALGAYKPIVIVNDMAYLSGHLPLRPDGSMITGKVGEDLDIDAGYQAARRAGLTILATLKAALGRLSRVRRAVKITGFVNAPADFEQHPAVINGCSELLIEVFGPDAGCATRSAVGAGSLPLNVAVEIEAIVQLGE